MRNPAGRECLYYYEDFYRGKELRECRAPKASRSTPWRPAACSRCPVPGILQANSSPYLQLTLDIRPKRLGLGGNVRVEAWCTRHGPVGDPYTGCTECCGELPEP